MRKMVCLLVSFILISANLFLLPIDGRLSNKVMAQQGGGVPTPPPTPPPGPPGPTECDRAIKALNDQIDEIHKGLDDYVKRVEKILNLTKKKAFREGFKRASKDIAKKAAERGIAKGLIFSKFMGPIGYVFDLWTLLWLADEVTEAFLRQDLLDQGYSEEEATRMAEGLSDILAEFLANHPTGGIAALARLFTEIEKFIEGRPTCFVGNRSPKPPPIFPKIPTVGGGGEIRFMRGGGGGNNGGLVPCHKECVEVYDPQTGKIDRECNFVCSK